MPTPKFLAQKWERSLPLVEGQWTHWRLDGDGVEIGIYAWQEPGGLMRALDEHHSRFSSIYAQLARIDGGGTTILHDERVLITNKARDSALLMEEQFHADAMNHESSKKVEPLWVRLFVGMTEWVDGEKKPKSNHRLLKSVFYLLKVVALFFFIIAFLATLYAWMWPGQALNPVAGFFLGLTMLPMAILFTWAWLFVWAPRIFRSGQSVAPRRGPLLMLPMRLHLLMTWWVRGVFFLLLTATVDSIYGKWLMNLLNEVHPQLPFVGFFGILFLFYIAVCEIWRILDSLIPPSCPRCSRAMGSGDYWEEGSGDNSFFRYDCRGCGLRWTQQFFIWGKFEDMSHIVF
jgi:hypothetical protein